jgi:hypothetical protein
MLKLNELVEASLSLDVIKRRYQIYGGFNNKQD